MRISKVQHKTILKEDYLVVLLSCAKAKTKMYDSDIRPCWKQSRKAKAPDWHVE